MLELTQVEDLRNLDWQVPDAYYHVGTFYSGQNEAVWIQHNSKEFLAVLCGMASNQKVKLNQKAAFNHMNMEGFSVLMAD